MHRLVAAFVLVLATSFAVSAHAAGECGETEVEAGATCEIADGAECESECAGDASCEAACDADGALFCDGAFIDAPDLERCVDYLGSIGVEVEIEASGSAACEGDDCEAEAKGDGEDGDDEAPADDGGCAASGAGRSARPGGVAFFAGLIALAAFLRRRRA
jgi:hypothetical protein